MVRKAMTYNTMCGRLEMIFTVVVCMILPTVAEVNIDTLLNESAMWLDAASSSSFEFSQDGDVTEWKNRSSSGSPVYGNARAYQAGSAQKYGKCQNVCGVPAYDMGAIASGIDLNYTEISGIRTVFIVGSFVASPSGTDYHVPLLGHSTRYDFHRGDKDALWSTQYAPQSFGGTPQSMTFYLNSDTETVADTDTTKPLFNALNIITIAVDGAVTACSDQLSMDRKQGNGLANGGRALSEVLIFTRELTAEERMAVYAYLDAKWNNGGWLSYLSTSTWNTGDGTWTDTAWNNDASGWNVGEFRHLVFDASVAGLGETAEIQTSGGTKNVGNVVIAPDAPRYIISGANLVEAQSFTSTATAGFSWSAPLKVYGDMTLASTTAGQLFSNLKGVGGVAVPAAGGGEVALAFTSDSAFELSFLSIGSGKTVELANRQGGDLFISKVTGDASTKLRLTGDGVKRTMFKGSGNDFSGCIEIDGARMSVEVNANSLVKITATEESPLLIRGETGSVKFGCKKTAMFLPDNAWISVEDGGSLELWGVNPNGQDSSPSVTLMNGSVFSCNDGGDGTYHMHLKHIHMKGNSEVHMIGNKAGWESQGLILWDRVTVSAGSSRIWREADNPNTLEFAERRNGEYTTVPGTFEVQDGATLTLAVKTGHPPHKTGAGLLVLDDGCELANGTLYLDEGLLKANPFAAALDRIEVQDGAGFDLTAEGSEFGSSSTSIVSASGAHVRLKTGERVLHFGMRLGSWAAGAAPSCYFVLEQDSDVARNYCAVVRDDGVYVESAGLRILVR